MPGNNNN